ncbi:hypothetical protein F4821DRAFT_32930 [Hypoxylon rubiginosum]|uniref:Uncharacterized protein n=1 Tax=Hypoxylon rubiginosum TaxID=110542 RepID=A0ACC0CLM0_9PEZI|nr:hypothetical protein F4821DRAFT_32930 [Hypoxylon rubiginosum]
MPSSTMPTTTADIQPHRFEWRKSVKGVWERDIDECEEFYRLSAREGSGCYPVTGYASFTTDLSSTTATANESDNDDEIGRRIQDAFRKAWMTLCYRHPTLRSRIEHDETSKQWRRVYSTFKNKDEEQDWLSLTFKTVDIDVAPMQWFNTDSTNFEVPTLFLVRSKAETQCNQNVFLRCPHDITDGVGTLQLVDQLFAHAATACDQGVKYVLPTWGDEHKQLSPSLRVAAAIPESFSDAQNERFKEIQTRNGTVYNHAGLLGLPSTSAAAVSQKGKRQRLSKIVPKDTTGNILRGCKTIAPSISVTHVFLSALAQALSELQPQKKESYLVRYVNHSMINLRPYCRDPYNTPDHAAAAYHTVSAQALGIGLIVPGASASKANDLSQIAVKVRDYYKTVRPVFSIDDQVLLAPLMFKALTPAPSSDPHAVSDPPFCPVALSSIGNVSSMVSPMHGPFQITNTWAASEPIGAGVALFLGTWDGKIELSSVFDTRYHDAAYVEKFLGRIVNCVGRGLGIDQHATPSQGTPVETTESRKRKRDGEESQADNNEDDSSGRPSKSPVRSALQERPALGNAQRISSKKVEENTADDLCVEVSGL